MNREASAYDDLAESTFAADAPVSERSTFIKRTYLHLLGAVLAFGLLLTLWMNLPGIDGMVRSMVSGYAWVGVMIAFLVVSAIAERMARNAASLQSQYIGLSLYVLLESIIFVPLMYVALKFGGAKVVPTAVIMTLVLFGGMTMIVFSSKADFSFLGSVLWAVSLAAVGYLICAMLFGFGTGVIFTAIMIGVMCLWILYDTSNVLHHYHTTQHVAASLALFASLATLFWYVLRLAMVLSKEE